MVGGLAGGVLGYLVGDYVADKRERCSPPVQRATPCADLRPVQQPCAPTYPQAPQYAPPQYDPPQYAPPQVAPPCAPPIQLRPRRSAGRRGRARNPNVAAARQAIEQGRRAATLPEARAAYEQAVRLDPQSADAWNALGLARNAAADRAGADDAFRRALTLDPHHYAARENLGWVGSRVR